MNGFGNKENVETMLQESKQHTEIKTVRLKITGMTCSGCANHIDKALSQKDGIIDKEIIYPGDVAVIKYDSKKIAEKDIIDTIEKAGYKAEVKMENKRKNERRAN